MVRGYVPETGQTYTGRDRWIEGEVEKSIWTGIKTKDRAVYHVDAFRCDTCGALRFYALDRAE